MFCKLKISRYFVAFINDSNISMMFNTGCSAQNVVPEFQHFSHPWASRGVPIQRWGIYPWARRTHCPNGFNSQCPISIHCPPTVNPSGPSSHQLGMLYDNTLQTHLYLTNIFRIVTIYGTDASSRVCLKSSNFIQSSWHKNTEKYKKAPRQVLVN